jgi:peptide deformylase
MYLPRALVPNPIRSTLALTAMAPYRIRVFGDPVLKQRAAEVTDIDGKLARLAGDMITTMYEAPGLGLAAPQVGVQKRLFVYDLQDDAGAKVLVNPTISESDGEWVYEEGCLSVPGLSWEIMRPKEVHLTGYDLDGNEVALEADELLARLFQHELDHLDGVLMVDRLDEEQRKGAKRLLRERFVDLGVARPAVSPGGLTLP